MKKTITTLLSLLILCFTYAQSTEGTMEERFHDDVLDHLVGKWDVIATVHNAKFTLKLEAEWVLNHQHLHIHFKSNEIVPWLKMPFEQEMFLGYNRVNKRYFVHEVSVHGGNNPYEGFCYAYKTGNEFKLMKKMGDSDTISIQRLIWEPGSQSWQIVSNLLVDGKEEKPFIDMKLTAVKPSTK